MIFWHSILLIVVWLTIFTLAGRLVADLLQWRQRAHARLYLGPVLGLALYLIIATATGWLFGAHFWLSVPITIGISLLALAREKSSGALAQLLGFLYVTGLLVSFGVIASIYRYGAYSVYNDTFTYLVHSQWLQGHSFSTPAAITPFQPAYTQVALYQIMGARMGASFLLAWIQAASPFEWSIDVYPGTVSLFLITGTLAIGGLVAALVPARRLVVLCWCVTAGTALSGFSYGAVAGFFPQTCALALMTGLLALLVNLSPYNQSGSDSLKYLCPLSLVFAAVGFAYSEILPLLGTTLAIWFMIITLISTRHRKGRWLITGSVFVLFTVVLWNGEIIRIMRSLKIQSMSLAGWPVPWTNVEFYSHAAGLRSGSMDGDSWAFPSPMLGYLLFVITILLIVKALIACIYDSKYRRGFLGIGAYSTLCLFAFLYFRYVVVSPWHTGTGQTWHQYKISNWVSPVILTLIGIGLVLLLRRRVNQLIAISLFAAFIFNNITTNYKLAAPRVAELMRRTGVQRNPFSAYKDLRTFAHSFIDSQEHIFIDLGGQENKGRQLVAYFLHDIPLVSDWSDDTYIAPWLPAGWEKRQSNNSKWWIRRVNESDFAANRMILRSGALILEQTPDFSVSQESITGGHGVESDLSGWWVWTPDHVVIRLKVHGRLPAQVRLKFTAICAAVPRELDIRCQSGSNELIMEKVVLPEGWQSYTSSPFRADSQNITIEILSRSTPTPIGNTDSRPVTFLVKNVRLEFVQPLPVK